MSSVHGSGHERLGGTTGRERQRGSSSSAVGALGAAAGAAAAPAATGVDVGAVSAAGAALAVDAATGLRRERRQLAAMTRGLNTITAYTAACG